VAGSFAVGDLMRVLVACEFSGTVRRAFRERGHDAWSCDLLPAEDGSEFHIQNDALHVLYARQWDLLIFHAPCTRLSNSGVRWLAERNLWEEMHAAANFFRTLLNAPVPKIAGENPIMHRHARAIVGEPYAQIIQPWQFGHGETKATCLWLKGLPKLVPTNIVEGREARIHRMPPGPDRWKERSRTFPGIAKAMAEQWGQETLLAAQSA
jgi:hypothetical protein